MHPLAILAALGVGYYLVKHKKIAGAAPSTAAIPFLNVPGGNPSGQTGQAVVGNFAFLGATGVDYIVYVTGYSGGHYTGAIATWDTGASGISSKDGGADPHYGGHVGQLVTFADSNIQAVISKSDGAAAGWPTF